jgi:hypothetical protein
MIKNFQWVGLRSRKHSRYYSELLLNVVQESSLRSRGGPRRSSARVYLWLLLHLQLETRLRPSETLNFEALISPTAEHSMHFFEGPYSRCKQGNEFKAIMAKSFDF